MVTESKAFASVTPKRRSTGRLERPNEHEEGIAGKRWMADQNAPILPASATGGSQLADSGASCVGRGCLQAESGIGSEINTARSGDRMTPAAPRPDDVPAGLELSRSATEFLQQPLQKLRDLDRQELARQQDEVRSSMSPGEPSRQHREREAQDELKRALREVLERADQDDRFTLETLLRAVEAGQRDWAGGSLVREATGSGQDQQHAAGRRRGGAAEGVPVKILVAFVVASMAISARKLRLGTRVLQAAGAIKHWWHVLWCCHLAELISMAESRQHLAVDTAKQLLTGLAPGQHASSSEVGSSAASDAGSSDVFGYNSGVGRGKGWGWLRPWRWFGRRGKPAAEKVSMPPLSAPPGLAVGSGSPAKAALYGMTSANRMPMLPPRQRHSLDPSAFSGLYQNRQPPPPPPAFNSSQRECRSEDGGLRHGFSFRTFVEQDPQSQSPGLRPSSSEGDLTACGQDGCAEGGSPPPASPTAQSPDAFSFAALPAANRIKADFLTARTTSFREWQQTCAQGVAHSDSCSSLPARLPLVGEQGMGQGPVNGTQVPGQPVDVIAGLPRAVSAESLALSSGGFSFRTAVEDAANLPSPRSPAPLKSADKTHARYAPSAQTVF
eukprot:jgi/Tetstr1/442242/TSEL_030383.t1